MYFEQICSIYFFVFQAELRAKSDESHYLRESLSRSREKFDQEVRLNSAIKLKKVTDNFIKKTYHLLSRLS